jgi:hypothetical protein
MNTAIYSSDLEGFEQLHEKFSDLYFTIYNAQNPAEKFDSLPIEEKRRYALTKFLTETANGGLDQYFWNESGDEWLILMDLFTHLNANTCLATLKACVAVFGEDAPSTDCRTRRSQVEAIYDRGTNINKLVQYAVDPDICTKFITYYNKDREQARYGDAEESV